MREHERVFREAINHNSNGIYRRFVYRRLSTVASSTVRVQGARTGSEGESQLLGRHP